MNTSSPSVKIVFLSLVFSILPFTSSFAGSAEKELNDYTAIQTLLAKDTFEGVTDASKTLSTDAKTNHHDALSAASDKLTQTKDIKTARAEFLAVSKEILPLAKSDKSKNFEVVYCPMKKARWVQKK